MIRIETFLTVDNLIQTDNVGNISKVKELTELNKQSNQFFTSK